MDDHTRRSSAAASRTNSPTLKELFTLVDNLIAALPQSSTSSTADTIQTQCDCLRRIRQLLIDSPDSRQLKDAFRQAKGLTALIDTLRSVSGFYNPSTLSKDDHTEFFELLKAVLAVLSEALNDHPGNRRFFRKKVEDGGWRALEQALISTGVGGGFQDTGSFDDAGQEQLFGCLVAFALAEENMARIFRDIRSLQPDATNGDHQPDATEAVVVGAGNADKSAEHSRDPTIGMLEKHLAGFFSGNEVLQNPEILPVIINTWLMLFQEKTVGSRSPRLSTSVLLVLERIIAMSAHNKLAAHGTGVLKTLLPLMFEAEKDSSEHFLLSRLTEDLISYGINDLDDARYLYKLAAKSEEAAKFLLSAIQSSRQAPFIQLDMSLHGYTSIELRDLGRTFPPTSSNGGYTITAWLRVDKYDDNFHTTIFGAYDSTQTCFVLVYLEKGSHYLILQTSTTSSRPSVRFKSAVFEEAKEERSEILSAMRHKAGAILPESRILLSISPTAVMDDDDRNHIDETQLVKSLSKAAAKNLRYYTRSAGHRIAINAAVPSINDALCQVNGVAILAGEPVVVVPQSLDDASWRVGGTTAIGLKLVELATTRNALMTAVQIMFESVHDNWRNSEAMEREHGFAVLAALLRDKLGLGSVFGRATTGQIDDPDHESLSYELLQLILRFVGFEEHKPQESKIINPLAYRALLIDFDIWRKCSADTQKLYYRQFECFAKDSKYHVFNAKRLTRMRIIKRLLDALKGENFTGEVFPHFLNAFKALLKCSVSSDILRSLALFITFALQENRTLVNRPLRSGSNARQMKRAPTQPLLSNSSPSTRPMTPSLQTESEVMPKKELGVKILEAYAAFLCDDASATEIRRFAKTVTNKWLVYLLAENDARVIVPTMQILARLLVIQGPHFVKKFTKDGGFTNLKHRLKAWWNTPPIWTICFAILFGADVGRITFERDFDLFNLMDAFSSANGQINIAYPDIFPAMTAMLETGIRVVVKQQEALDRPATSQGENGGNPSTPSVELPKGPGRKRSMSLESELSSRAETPQPSSRQKLVDYAAILHTIIQFLADVHMKSPHFREYAIASNYIQDLLFVLYPVIVTSDSVSAETELHSRGSALTFEGQDVLINPQTGPGDSQPSIVRTTPIEAPRSPSASKATPLRRGNSFILISSDKAKYPATSARLHTVLSPKRSRSSSIDLKVGNAVVQSLLELVIGVFLDQLLHKKDFTGFGLFLKVPPGFQEHQAYFESYVLLHTMQMITNELQLRQDLLSEPRVLTNLARYTLHMAEAVFEGWFLNGAEALLDFIGTVLDYLHRPDVAQIKAVRLCTQAISTVRTVFFRVALLRLSELDEPDNETEAIAFLHKMTYWQTIILHPDNLEGNYLRLLCYLLYTKFVSGDPRVRAAAADFWRLMLVQKPDETSQMLNQTTSSNDRKLFTEFMKLTELDNDAFLAWVDERRSELDNLFFGAMSKSWEEFVTEENRKTEESAKTRVSKRRERLKQWQAEEEAADNTWHRHEVSTTHWRANIFAAERLKHQRAQQDQQDNLAFLASALGKLDRSLREPCALLESEEVSKWQLDETEGRNRMRLRILPDKTTARNDEYQPKRRDSEGVHKTKLSLVTNIPQIATPDAANATPNSAHPSGQNGRDRSVSQSSVQSNADDDFEFVADPNEGEDGFEDKNRKVMRTLQSGDQVQHVFNVSRIVGLEACEGLLILGKDSLYLLDNFFQRSDGEIIRVWQAPPEERDSYVQMISGKKATERRPQMVDGEQSTRNWKWPEVISISKRRFLFRDVAIEIFFTDGRSYLLTAIAPKIRDDLHARLLSRAPQVTSPSALQSEDAWRLESLRTPEEAPPSMASKWVNALNPMAQNPATKKWLKGEISNFHYLMLVNTMAGRTFNDLTQYPVFPWILADYTSEELDLTNPKTFRDLSKPMGAQTKQREAEFKERYQTFAEMSDGTNPVFHYGTHYSSAMIVTSYLIRLQPFVQSYLLLQGGSFDHADRLFDSIEKAWKSASRDNMTDVRELIPEFFYLPEFLSNMNGYNFGTKQVTGEKINDVALPPWAKGDPEIFIAKHREALESPYVTKNLHKWIDLVFGYKQQGDAAVDATNVFHYLSYHGAKDLDNIDDPVERLATIGIIHNFGQTPHQVFQKPHPPRGDPQKPKRLDGAADSLTRLPFTLLDAHESVASLTYHPKQERILCSAAFRINIPPSYDRYMEWGFADGSVRFYATDSKKLIGLWEHLHQGQISCATFVDGKTLITAGTDCTVAVWNVVIHSKTVDLVPKVCFFGHRAPVTVLATSRAFSTFLSADPSGEVFLWDLNRLEFVRRISKPGGAAAAPVSCARINNVNGHVMLCTGSRLLLYTLNGRLLLDQDVCDSIDPDDVVYSCAFYEGVGNEWLERELILTGHRRGVVNVWQKTLEPGTGEWILEVVKRLNHVDPAREDGGNYPGAVTCILPMAQTVYTGDDDGKVRKYSSSGIAYSDMVERRRTRKKHGEDHVVVVVEQGEEEEEKTTMRWKDKVKKSVKRGWTLDVHLAGIGVEEEEQQQPTPPQQQPIGKKEKKKGKEKLKLEKYAGSWVHLGGTCSSMPSFDDDDDDDEGEEVCVGPREAADVAGKERWRRERGAAPPMRW
ncbi:Beige protein-like protein 1 [Lasiodiplodia theobromae]|uniref:Beige protein-like protein 1 n=1 Tax=Lasiodiplodia theobromae TaxID=45133 RepID=A0A5N5D112_9PEZI|nr:Beige protein-like protein 1 [Lasiodiplodia theobromae]